MKRINLFFLAGLSAIQLLVPLQAVWTRENVLQHGTVHKFRIAPVDPMDPFRGRYLALDIQQSRITLSDASRFARKQRVYAVLGKDEEGYAKIMNLSPDKPSGQDYIRTKILYVYNNEVTLDLPFKRYYLNEKAAPEAEKYYFTQSRQASSHCYVSVRVLGSHAVLEELYLDDKPLPEILNTMKNEAVSQPG